MIDKKIEKLLVLKLQHLQVNKRLPKLDINVKSVL